MERLGLQVAALGIIEGGEIVHALKRVGMLLAEHPLTGFQRALIERLGVRVAALGLIEGGEIVHACKRVGMLLAKDPVGKRESLLSDGGCFPILSLAVKLDN